MQKILIVEDDESIARMIQVTLSMGNYVSSICNDGLKARQVIENGKIDLILLDIMLPGIDGFSLMKEIRPYNIPVIFITAKQEITDKVNGLKLGAEDYIVKPFDSMELLARIEVVLRRFQKEEKIIAYKNIRVNNAIHEVTLDGEIVNLPPKEYDTLMFFLNHQNVIIRKERLLSEIWGYDFVGESRSVEIHVQHVRRKLNLQNELTTIPKIGYCLKNI